MSAQDRVIEGYFHAAVQNTTCCRQNGKCLWCGQGREKGRLTLDHTLDKEHIQLVNAMTFEGDLKLTLF